MRVVNVLGLMTDEPFMIRSTKRAARELMRVQLINPPFPITLVIRDFRRRMFELVMVMSLRERDTGIDYVNRFVTECTLPVSRRKFIRFVDASLREAMLHELYESLHVDGERHIDLHEGHDPGETGGVPGSTLDGRFLRSRAAPRRSRKR